MKKSLILVYGILAYIAFFMVFLYLIGFVSGVIVPKDINTGDSNMTFQGLFINFCLVFLFALQHTVMARPVFKKWWTTIIPVEAERSTFVLLTSMILALLFWQWQAMPVVLWEAHSPWLAGLLYTTCALGFSIVLYASFLINHFDLFGLWQVCLQYMNRPYTHPDLKVVSLYRYVRHPLMLGMLIAFWATPHMTVGHFVFASLFSGYILFGTRIEEKTLLEELGETYRQYQASTPALIPTLQPTDAIVRVKHPAV